MRVADSGIANRASASGDGLELPDAPSGLDGDRYRRALESTLGSPFTEGNRITVLKNGCQIFPAMLEAIEEAEAEIQFLTFVYWTGEVADRFADALARKAREGVRVEVILDAYGAKKMKRSLVAMMRKSGVNVQWFRPPNWRIWHLDNRTHRKVLICDGRVGFTGGVGIAEEWEGDARNPREWRDTHFRVEGPAVHGIHAAFLGNWVEIGRRVQLEQTRFPFIPPAGDAHVMTVRSVASMGWSDMATLFQTVLQLARREICISTPYFVPDRDTAELLCEAAKRGVSVRVQVAGPHTDEPMVRAAARSKFGKLLRSGVQIYRYQPTMLHTKCLTVDGVLACVGSANLNHRSLRKDDEFCLAILHAPTVAVLDRHFEEDLRRCEPVRERSHRERDLVKRVKERAGRLLQPQL